MSKASDPTRHGNASCAPQGKAHWPLGFTIAGVERFFSEETIFVTPTDILQNDQRDVAVFF